MIKILLPFFFLSITVQSAFSQDRRRDNQTIVGATHYGKKFSAAALLIGASSAADVNSSHLDFIEEVASESVTIAGIYSRLRNTLQDLDKNSNSQLNKLRMAEFKNSELYINLMSQTGEDKIHVTLFLSSDDIDAQAVIEHNLILSNIRDSKKLETILERFFKAARVDKKAFRRPIRRNPNIRKASMPL